MSKQTTAIAKRASDVESFRNLFEQWLADKLKTSVASYRIDLESFARFRGSDDAASAFASLIDLANKNPGSANSVLFAYRMHMTQVPVWNSSAAKRAGRPADRVGMAPATINRRLAAIRSFISVVRAAGRTQWLPEIPGVKHKKYRDTSGVGDEAVQILVDHLEEQSKSDLLTDEGRARAIRDLAMVCLMANMALRKSSLITLDLEHVDRRRKRLHCMLKGDRDRAWKLCDSVTWDAIERWIDARGEDPGPLLCSFHPSYMGGRLAPASLNKILIARAKEVTLSQRAKPHGFRHTAITRALEMGFSIREVSHFADHVKIDTTMIYDDRRQEPSRGVAEGISGYSKATVIETKSKKKKSGKKKPAKRKTKKEKS